MAQAELTRILHLPVSERLRAVEAIWDSIVDEGDGLELTDDQRRILDERIDAYDRNPHMGVPWEDVRARLKARQR